MYSPHPDTGPHILYQDNALLAVEKPSGLLSVPGRGAEKHDSLSVRIQSVYPEALIVHRLDMATSGLMLFARDRGAQSAMGRLFQTRQVHKEYIALVAGQVDPLQGEIDLPLIADWPNRPRQRVDHEIGKPALTRYEVLEYDAAANISRVCLTPVTGRSHQLRVHMQALGYPILGDELYAGPATHAHSPRLLLHAHRLCFRHPMTGELLMVESPVPF